MNKGIRGIWGAIFVIFEKIMRGVMKTGKKARKKRKKQKKKRIFVVYKNRSLLFLNNI